MVNGAWWAAVTQPVILSFGSLLAAVDTDVLDVHLIDWNKWIPFLGKGKKTPPDAKEKEEPVAKEKEENTNENTEKSDKKDEVLY